MKLGDIFRSGMVLAAGKPIRFFGEGAGHGEITFANQSKEIISNNEFWCVEFPGMEYGGPHEIIFKTESTTVVLNNVYVGEVYLFSGQSNMTMMLEETNTSKARYADDCRIRYVDITPIPEDIIDWQAASRECIGKWSALGYLVCKDIADKKNIHVGAVVCARGATAIESWVPMGAFEAIGINIQSEDKYPDHRYECNVDGRMYQSKLMRAVPYSFSGVVWYQGESDASVAEGKVYRRELCELIRIWREDLRDESLPFTVVQIADCASRIALGPGWEMIQAAQEEISKHEDNVYTVISKDVCETDAIHPPSKDALAKRITDIILTHYFN